MYKKKLTAIIAVAAAITVIAGIVAYAASNYGTSTDPLVTLSYLSDTLTPDLLKRVDAKVAEALSALTSKVDEALEDSGASVANFVTVSLKGGQTLKCASGAEVMLRNGACTVTYVTGLPIDEGGGSAPSSGGSLTANKLYLLSGDDCAIRASTEGASFLVRGSYTVS